MNITLDRIQNNGKLVPKQVLDRAIILAQASIDDWSRQDLESYVLDRLSDEISVRLMGVEDET